MSERYSRLFLLEENLYTEGSPVVIKAGTLLKDNETGWLIGQIKMQNISPKTVKTLKTEFTFFDSVGRPIGTPLQFDYLDLNAFRGCDFGAKTPVKIPDTMVRAYAVKVLEVGFADNSIWSASQCEWEPLHSQKPIHTELVDAVSLKGYVGIFGENAKYVMSQQKDLWLCTCGSVNHEGEERCHQCNASLNDLQQLDKDMLKQEGAYISAVELSQSRNIPSLEEAIAEFLKLKDYKNSQELAEVCKTKVSKIIEDNKRENTQKSKKIKLLSFVAGGIALLALIGYFAIYPLISCMTGNYRTYINMYNIKEFIIPDRATSIDEEAFRNCSSLTSITIPDSVTSIGNSAFEGCESLTSVTLGNGVVSIGNHAFKGCESLTSVTLGNGVESIGWSAFEGCASLTSITIPDSVKSIDHDAFRNCTSLTSVTIPDSVTSIGGEVFFGCTRLVMEKINGVSYIGTLAIDFDNSVAFVEIREGTTVIAADAFAYCSNLISITIPDSVTSIGNSAFSSCKNLRSITIPDGITSIEMDVFGLCSSLKSITIPDSVRSIGYCAFSGCSSLTSIYFEGTKGQWSGISKSYNWDNHTYYTVYCTDGTISK